MTPETRRLPASRARHRITEPLITFYEAIMRPRWADLEIGLGAEVWADTRPAFAAQVLGPHFEGLCREFARTEGRRLVGVPVGEVASGTVADPGRKTQIEVDVAVLAPARRPAAAGHLAGEAKWGKVMGGHLERLRRAQALLNVKDFDTTGTTLACYSGAGFDPDLHEAARRGDVLLVGLDQLYGALR